MSSDQENQGEAIYSDDGDNEFRESYLSGSESKYVEGSVNDDLFEGAPAQQQSTIPEQHLHLKQEKAAEQSQAVADFVTEASTIQELNRDADQSQRYTDSNVQVSKNAISELQVEYHQLGEGLKLSEKNELMESLKRDTQFVANQNKSELDDGGQDLVLIPTHQHFEGNREGGLQNLQTGKDTLPFEQKQQDNQVNVEESEDNEFEDVQEQVVAKQQKDGREEIVVEVKVQQVLNKFQDKALQNQVVEEQRQNNEQEKAVEHQIDTIVQQKVQVEIEQGINIPESNVIDRQLIQQRTQDQKLSQQPVSVQQHVEVTINVETAEDQQQIAPVQHQHKASSPEKIQQHQQIHLEGVQNLQNNSAVGDGDKQIAAVSQTVRTQQIEVIEIENPRQHENEANHDDHIQESIEAVSVQQEQHIQIHAASSNTENQIQASIQHDQHPQEIIKHEDSLPIAEAIVHVEPITLQANHPQEQPENIIEQLVQLKQEIVESNSNELHQLKQIDIKKNDERVGQIGNSEHLQLLGQNQLRDNTQNDAEVVEVEVTTQQDHVAQVYTGEHQEERIHHQNAQQSLQQKGDGQDKQPHQELKQQSQQIVLQERKVAEQNRQVQQLVEERQNVQVVISRQLEQLPGEGNHEIAVEKQTLLVNNADLAQQIKEEQIQIVESLVVAAEEQKQPSSLAQSPVQHLHEEVGLNQQKQAIQIHLLQVKSEDDAAEIQHEKLASEHLLQKQKQIEGATSKEQLYSVMKQAVQELIIALPEKRDVVDNNEVDSQVLDLKPIVVVSDQGLIQQRQVKKQVFVSERQEFVNPQIQSHPVVIEQALDNNNDQTTKKGRESSIIKKPLPIITAREAAPKKEQAISKSTQSCKCAIM